MKKFLLLPVLFLVFYNISAQGDSIDINSFNRYYEKSIDKLRELVAVKRSVGFDCNYYKGYDYKSEILKLIRKFENEFNDNAGEYKNRNRADHVAIIFYSAETDTLRIWLFRNNRIYYHFSLTTKQQLADAELQLRQALGVDELRAARSPYLRGGETRNTVSAKTAPDVAINTATSILLPAAIRKGLHQLHHLIIIPEYNIGQFPFGILKPYKENSFLIDSMSVSFAPHLCNLAMVDDEKERFFRRKNSFHAARPLIVGNPSYYNTGEIVFPPLPGAEQEAKAIAALMHTNAITGKEATAGKIIAASMQADFLYFATHGFFDFEKLLKGSFLAFTPDDSIPNGFWTADSIQRVKLKADLAVLSACQTGVGKIYEGGFIGIGRSFYIAGVDNTVISLWSVNDESTKNLMVMFMNQLQQPDYFFPASHLRKAILEYKRKDNTLAHWAPFMVFGFTY